MQDISNSVREALRIYKALAVAIVKVTPEQLGLALRSAIKRCRPDRPAPAPGSSKSGSRRA
jgi:hypothetical protein